MTVLARDLQSRFLRYFIALYETRSITHAADKLCITQPALSNSMRTLENQLGATLFDRLPQGVTPTVYADALYRRAKMSEAELHLATVEMEQIRDSDIGSVRLGIGPSTLGVCARFLPQALAAKPKLEVSVVEGAAQFLMEQISAGKLDFAICMTHPGVSYPELDFRFIGSSPAVAVARRDHPLAGRSIERRELSHFPWIVADGALESSADDLLTLLADVTPQTITSTNSPSLMRMMIAASDFISFMPRIVLENYNASGALAALDLRGGIYDRHLFVITRKRSFLPPASAYLVSEFCKAIEGPLG